ncbi:MAG TPA: thioredoxin domain-containing protein, partial [Longimicrobium sp.]|nr:thioredoxin domain-containing protein [Longimicrobium sp.]
QVNAGRVRFTVHPLPLPTQSASVPAAAMLACASAGGAPDAFWKLRTEVMRQQARWSSQPDPEAALLGIAAGAGLDTARIRGCMDDGAVRRGLQGVWKSAERAHLAFTPVYAVNGRIVFWGNVRSHVDSLLRTPASPRRTAAPAHPSPAGRSPLSSSKPRSAEIAAGIASSVRPGA